LELNQEGYGIRRISQLLNQRYNIKLSPSAVQRHITELRQAPDNDVQVNFQYTGSGKLKEERKWYKIILAVKEYLPKYQKTWGSKPSLRTAFYDMQDMHLLGPNEYDSFDEATVTARLGWVDSNGELIYPKLDIDCFSDEKIHSVTAGYYGDFPPIEPTPPTPITDPDEYVDYHIERLKRAPRYYSGRGEPGRAGRIGGYWYNQPKYVEVWEEKVDLVDNFEELLRPKQVKVRGNGGFTPLMFLFKCTKELKELIEQKGIEPEDVYIKYCGDWDPSGEQIDYYIQKRLRQLGIQGVNFERVMITPEQIDDFILPLMDITKKDPIKKWVNPNLREFQRKYGNKATHLNAMMTLEHKEDTKKILFDAIDQHHDPDIYQDMLDEYLNSEPDEPDSLSEKELDEARQEMYDEITRAFSPGWEEEEEGDLN
jgi:hypothetical protein